MAVTQISRIQHRRGKKQDLPEELHEGEFGFTVDTGELYIGAPNFTFPQGRSTNVFPYKNVKVLTEFSNVSTVTTSEYLYSLPGTPQPGATETWTVERSLQDKLDDIASVKDYGAIGDGLTDDTQPIIRAIIDMVREELGTNGTSQGQFRALYFPAGIYLVTQPIPIPPRLVLYGDGISKGLQANEGGNSIIVSDFTSTNFNSVNPYAFTTVDASITDITAGSITYNDIDNRAGMNIGTGGTTPDDIFVIGLGFHAINYTNSYPNLTFFRLHRSKRIVFERCKFVGEYDCSMNSDPLNEYYNVGTHSLLFDIDGLGDVHLPEDIYFNFCEFSKFNRAFIPVNRVKNVSVQNSVFTEMFKPIAIGEDEMNSGSGTPGYYHLQTSPDHKPMGWMINNCRFNNINSNAIGVYCQYNTGTLEGTGHISAWNKFENVGNDCNTWNDTLSQPMVPSIVFQSGTNYNQSIGDIFYYDGNDDSYRLDYDGADKNTVFNPQMAFLPDPTVFLPVASVTLTDSASSGTTTGIAWNPNESNQIIIKYSVVRGTNDLQGEIRITCNNTNGSDFNWHDNVTETGDVGFQINVEWDGNNVIQLTYEDTNPTGTNGTLYYNVSKWLSD